jgi:hypothetical protein
MIFLWVINRLAESQNDARMARWMIYLQRHSKRIASHPSYQPGH